MGIVDYLDDIALIQALFGICLSFSFHLKKERAIPQAASFSTDLSGWDGLHIHSQSGLWSSLLLLPQGLPSP